MAIVYVKSIIPVFNYEDNTQNLINSHNNISEFVNLLFANQASGIIENSGIVWLSDGITSTHVTSNITLSPTTATNIIFENLEFYFASIRSWVKIATLDIPIIDIGASGTKYIYVDSAGEVIIVDSPYTELTVNLVRLARVSFNGTGQLYSFVVLPETSSTNKLTRSFIYNYDILHVNDTVISPVNNSKNLKRTNTKLFMEGLGSLDVTLMHTLTLPDAAVAKLLYVDDTGSLPATNSYITTFNTTTYIPILTGQPTPTGICAVCQINLSVDGTLIIQHGTQTYKTISDAAINMFTENFARITGDEAGEYIPVARIAYKYNATDLADTTQAAIGSMLTKQSTDLMWSNF